MSSDRRRISASKNEGGFRHLDLGPSGAEQALRFISNIRERLSIISLSGDEYADALETSASLGIVGGSIYDAMLARCAIKANAETIYTWNIRHYAKCGSDVAIADSS